MTETQTASPDAADDLLDAERPPATRAAVAELMPLLYEELRRSARRERRRVGAGDTYATTALVNELYVKMHRNPGFGSRADFLAVAAIAMRRILLEQVRARLRLKRGAGAGNEALDEDLIPLEHRDEQIVAVNDALQDLAKKSPRTASIVECRFFAGYSERETAEALGLSERTVQREWALARAWLQRALGDA